MAKGKREAARQAKQQAPLQVEQVESDVDALLDDQQESIEDVEAQQGVGWQHGATLWGTDWTTETIINQLLRGNIELSPKFQRRNAWRDDRKSRFIESLILGLPIPQLILAESKARRGAFIVIDGKQRLLSLLQFASDEGGQFQQLRLGPLRELPDLEGQSLTSLKANDAFIDYVRQFENQTVRTIVIRNWENDLYLYNVFLRINSGSVQLSPQELRQALHPGEFSSFVDDYSIESPGVKRILNLREPDFRMRDAELALRYFAYKNFASTYNGNLKAFLDATTEHFNQHWGESRESLAQQGQQLEEAISLTERIFPGNAFKKWNGKAFENKFNRAIFDIMVFYFSDPNLRDAIGAEHVTIIRNAFLNLCVQNAEFRSSVEATTKSLAANRARFGAWGTVLGEALGRQIVSPIRAA